MADSRDSSRASEADTRPSQAGQVAGRYRLVRELGRGGMGVVWLAEDADLGREVAVKELRPPPGLPEAEREVFRLRARQEARSAARIRHPGAVTLYEAIPAGGGDDAVYLIMELIDGPTLAQLVARDGPLPAARVAALGAQLLDVLQAAHALGIVHRDVKPGNILITAGGQPKLADFGIAHTLGDPRLTTSGVMGTQAYQAPELFESAPVTPAADLWSLGATLYYAADGHGPFDRDSTGATLRAIILDDLPVPRTDPHLAAAITALLHRDPATRATTDQARALLRQVPAIPSATGRNPSPPGYKARDWNPGAETRRRSSPPLVTPAPQPTPGSRRTPRFPGGRRAAFAAAVLVAAAAATGSVLAMHPGSAKGAPSGHLHTSSTSHNAPSSAPVGRTTTATTAPPSTTVTRLPQTSPSPTTAPAAVTACATGSLTATAGPLTPNAGSIDQAIDFTNVSRATCTLYGYPGAALATGPTPASPGRRGGRPIDGRDADARNARARADCERPAADLLHGELPIRHVRPCFHHVPADLPARPDGPRLPPVQLHWMQVREGAPADNQRGAVRCRRNMTPNGSS